MICQPQISSKSAPDLPDLTERMKIEKQETYVQSALQQKLRYTHKSPETGNELWIATRRSKQGNWVQSGNMAEAIHKYEHKKDFFKLINNSVFEKKMENTRKHRDIKLMATERRRSHVISEPNYYASKWFLENLLAIEMNNWANKVVTMNKLVYLDLLMLDIKKILRHDC